MRRAEWQLRERERWTVWRLFGQPECRGYFATGLSFLALLVSIDWAFRLSNAWVILPSALVPIAFTLWPNRLVPPRIRDLALVPSDVPQHAVIVLFRFRGVKVGSDEGVLTFVEGWMHFEGLRTSFSLHPEDIANYESRAAGWDGMTMALKDVVKGTKLVVRPLTPYSNLNGERRFHFCLVEDFKRWRVGPRAKGESLYPPSAIHPMSDVMWNWVSAPLVVVSLITYFYFLIRGMFRSSGGTSTLDFVVLTALGIFCLGAWIGNASVRRHLARAVPNLPPLGTTSNRKLPVDRNEAALAPAPVQAKPSADEVTEIIKG